LRPVDGCQQMEQLAFVVLIDFLIFDRSSVMVRRELFDVVWGFLHELDRVVAERMIMNR
jgi:hypothetical protein